MTKEQLKNAAVNIIRQENPPVTTSRVAHLLKIEPIAAWHLLRELAEEKKIKSGGMISLDDINGNVWF